MAVDKASLDVISELKLGRPPNLTTDLRIVEREGHLDPAIQVPMHPIGGGQIDLFLIAALEYVGTPVLQITVNDTARFNALAELGSKGV